MDKNKQQENVYFTVILQIIKSYFIYAQCQSAKYMKSHSIC